MLRLGVSELEILDQSVVGSLWKEVNVRRTEEHRIYY